MRDLIDRLRKPGRCAVAGAPVGHDAHVLAAVAKEIDRDVLFVARDDLRMAQMNEGLAFFAPDIDRLGIPAWDNLPYDRVSPNPEVVSRRLDSLVRLAMGNATRQPRIVLTTVSALLQRVPPRGALADATMVVRRGDRLAPEALTAFLVRSGYARDEAVTVPGDFAARGGIVDVFPPGVAEPLRFDFFGDELETIRTFDSASQRTTGRIDGVRLDPVTEVVLDDAAIERFRRAYRALAGAVESDNPLYAAVSAGRRHVGMEHWLPLFYERLETLFDYLPEAPVFLDHQAEEARDARLELIADYYEARRQADAGRFGATGAPYYPVPPEAAFLTEQEWDARAGAVAVARLWPFAPPPETTDMLDAGGRPALDFAQARQRSDLNVFDEVATRIKGHRGEGRRVLVAAASNGSRDRLLSVFADHNVSKPDKADDWPHVLSLPAKAVCAIVLPLDRGFTTSKLAVIAETDILGERIARRAARRVRPENFLTETSSLNASDLVVHVNHGIGRYEGLETIEVDGAPHDCLRLVYAGDDRLLLPVENIDLISRYGSDTDAVALDRLGGAAWQGRKARLKARIREMADELIKVAAARALHATPQAVPTAGLFEEFCARFPYAETDDQARAIDDVLADLAAGRPADRLICGDVGFGKTEVALRAAFVVAMEGRQVAVVVPTTLLCRQHYQTFRERFRGYPVRIAEVSRLIGAKDIKATKAGLADGTIDIVVGTHALLARDVRFRELGLLVVDEEQHFGVAHKERLKALKADVHVLTLTATPIPRTLQMALSGVRELSLIATPPVDRLAVRTFVMEYDPVVIREALLREHYRGGQTFYVCPRIEDLDGVGEALAKLVPEVNVIKAHGRMAARALEEAIGAFYERRYDVLLSTNIIESGLDLPAVNTIAIHRADMFGLAQLYQLRGRVGRGKARAYAYLTLPPRRKLTATAEKRLQVMQSLDSLGAGFALASHDLDIRGAGNLLGDEQSGHIREVGIELYQQMLEDAVAEARGAPAQDDGDWSPQISLGLSVLIPEAYVPDLGLRLGLYRRLADLRDEAELDSFAAELVDRFGALPEEVDNLLRVVALKQICRRAGVEKVDAGPKGATLAFRDNDFANPAGLVALIGRQAGTMTLRPDHRLVLRRAWERPADRIPGVRGLIVDLERIAAG
ncbi:MAG: transcription-repair coupling factor [Rhodospirillales bacterium]|nr:transcription-repair coupling factor [Rhodospirillales bacterium]